MKYAAGSNVKLGSNFSYVYKRARSVQSWDTASPSHLLHNAIKSSDLNEAFTD